MMKRVFTLLAAGSCFFQLSVAAALSQEPSAQDPYGKANRLEGESLKSALHEVSEKTHTRHLGYDAARVQIMGNLHLDSGPTGAFIKDVYCQREFTSKECGPLKLGNVPPSTVLNVEHTWPQSRFVGHDKGTMKADLHHLYPSDSEMNSRRGNHKFGEVNGASTPLKCQQSALGEPREGRGVRFEPPIAHKGNVARALFYFSVRYNAAIDSDEERVLRQWHLEDPVDAEEIERNDKIEDLQGNRNPFIDHPEYVDRVSDF